MLLLAGRRREIDKWAEDEESTWNKKDTPSILRMYTSFVSSLLQIERERKWKATFPSFLLVDCCVYNGYQLNHVIRHWIDPIAQTGPSLFPRREEEAPPERKRRGGIMCKKKREKKRENGRNHPYPIWYRFFFFFFFLDSLFFCPQSRWLGRQP